MSPKSPLNQNIFPKALPGQLQLTPNCYLFPPLSLAASWFGRRKGLSSFLGSYNLVGWSLSAFPSFLRVANGGVWPIKRRDPKDLPTVGTSSSCCQTISRNLLGPPLLGSLLSLSPHPQVCPEPAKATFLLFYLWGS